MCNSTTCPNNKSNMGADFLCNCKPIIKCECNYEFELINEDKQFLVDGNGKTIMFVECPLCTSRVWNI